MFPYDRGYIYPYEPPGPYFSYSYSTESYSAAYVKVRSALIDSSTGNVICGSGGIIEGSANVRGYGSKRLQEASSEAVSDLVKRLEYQFAVVPVDVKISNDAIKTASAKKDDKWSYTSSFNNKDAEIYAVIKLPKEAARNNFRLTVTPQKEQGNILLSRDFTWQEGETEKSIPFSRQEILNKSDAGKYTINLYSLSEIVLSRNISVK
jgi:uncharacterized protein (DUF3084 family)